MTTTGTTPIEIPARIRRMLGKRVRFLRRQGLTPAHLYGKGIDSLPLVVEASVLQRVLVLRSRWPATSALLRVRRSSQPALRR